MWWNGPTESIPGRGGLSAIGRPNEEHKALEANQAIRGLPLRPLAVDAPLLTCDAKRATATNHRARVEVM
jgi:hypothetical protein